jgi:protein gp37
MNKTKIEWADYTWSPVTGCWHGCSYCYARRIANRFSESIETISNGTLYELNEPFLMDKPVQKDNTNRFCAYPYGFDPTFHRYRLDEPTKIKKPAKIFVCSMADLFGDWVPDEWIEDVFNACEATPQHTYMFLTKNPYRYVKLMQAGKLVDKPNFWYGTTCTNSGLVAFRKEEGDKFNTFLSIEPLLKRWTPNISHVFSGLQWVIVGAETGNRKDKVVPEKEWIDDIVAWCKRDKKPLFMKNSLKPIYGEELIQEWPK